MRWLCITSLILAAACQPTGPVTIRIHAFDDASGGYRTFDAPLSTLDDAVEMRGGVLSMRVDATVVADIIAVTPQDALRIEGGAPPRLSFTEQSGVLIPEDFDSLAMATAYWSLERARQFFEALGVSPDELNALKTFYHPRMQIVTKLVPTFWFLTDNAAYSPMHDAFLLVPHIALAELPFSGNLGVMAHEYSHKVHNVLVDRNARNPRPGWSAAATNQIAGVDEGLADVFGAALTRDSNFFAPSANFIGPNRDLAVERVITAQDALLALGLSVADGDLKPGEPRKAFDPHALGAFVASAIWQLMVETQAPERIARSVVDAERALGQKLADGSLRTYSVVGFWNVFLDQLPSFDRSRMCTLIRARFDELIRRDTANTLACP